MYKCAKCKRDIKEDEMIGKATCPFCGYRCLHKQRSNLVKKVRAR